MSYADNPRHPENPSTRTEHAGPIASDSLAAESLQSGGDFAANDPSNPQPMSVSGSKSTLANTDTSGAVPLHPASSGAAREAQDERGLGADERGVTGARYPETAGQPQFEGATTAEGYYGAPSSAHQSEGYSTGTAAGASDFGATTRLQDTSSYSTSMSATGGLPSTAESGSAAVPTPTSATGVRPYVDDAPTYTGRTAGTIISEGELKPKGDNLTEGDIPQTKTFLGDVGGPHDPGRLAERGFEKINAEAPGGGAAGRDYQTGKGNDKGGFEVLGSERA